MHRLTHNFDAWISKDGEHFTVRNRVINSADGGYRLGEYASFIDGRTEYLVTIKPSAKHEEGIVDLKVQE